MKKKDNRKLMLAVAFNEETGTYSVDIPSGSSVPETAFCTAIVAKCLVRDNVISNTDDFINLVKKYCDDPQYNELR